MNTIIGGSELSGTIQIPPSKSVAHRLLICAALSKHNSVIKCESLNDDIISTYKALNNIGANIHYENGHFYVKPIKEILKGNTIDCNESGSTLRFLISIFCALGTNSTFIGKGNLPIRPMNNIYDILIDKGITLTKLSKYELPIECIGKLTPGKYVIKGNISSQYLTGLLFALPLLDGDSEIEIDGELSSESYINITLSTLKLSGIEIIVNDNKYHIKGNQIYNIPEFVEVEGDWSSAAFWLVAGVIGKHPITIEGLNLDSKQGDKKIIDCLRLMGGKIECIENKIISYPSILNPIDLDCSDIPDLLPILSVAASTCIGKTKLKNVGRLRFKECNRLEATKELLNHYNIICNITSNDFIINGNNITSNDYISVSTFNDHRIAMSLFILSTLYKNEINIDNTDCICKSYPNFIKHFNSLIL